MTPTLLLVTMQMAKDHVRLAGSRSDSDIEFKIRGVSAAILNYLKIYPPDFYSPPSSPIWEAWDEDGAPEDIQLAVIHGISESFENRETDVVILSQSIKDLLHRYRDPAMA